MKNVLYITATAVSLALFAPEVSADSEWEAKRSAWAECLVAQAPEKATTIAMAREGDPIGIPTQPCGDLLPKNIDGSIIEFVQIAQWKPIRACVRAAPGASEAILAFQTEVNSADFAEQMRKFEKEMRKYEPGYNYNNADRMRQASTLSSAARLKSMAMQCNARFLSSGPDTFDFFQPLWLNE
jgi:hypothetical protein